MHPELKGRLLFHSTECSIHYKNTSPILTGLFFFLKGVRNLDFKSVKSPYIQCLQLNHVFKLRELIKPRVWAVSLDLRLGGKKFQGQILGNPAFRLRVLEETEGASRKAGYPQC